MTVKGGLIRTCLWTGDMSDHGDPCEKISVDEETVGLLACSHP